MKFSWNIKKIAIIFTLLLVCCDVTLLFAAQQTDAERQQTQQLPPTNTSVTPTLSPPASQGPLQAQNFNSNNHGAMQLAQAAPAAQPQSYQPVASPQPAVTPNGFPQQPASVAQPQALPVATPPAPAFPTPAQQQPAPVAPPASPQQPTEQMVSTQEVSDAAFNTVTQNALPMSPDQIQRLRQLFNQTQLAGASTPGTPPRPTATSQMVNLAPGATPPVIRLAQGFVSSLVFIDSTGAPWPIESYDIGNPAAFNIQWNKTDNTLMIQAVTLYTYGNLAVRLQGLSTPVMLTLIPGQKAVDYRVDLRIQGYGPNAKPMLGSGMPNSANPDLLGVLDGVPPVGSTAARVSGGAAEVWLKGDRMYVRTRFTILSPGWLATMSSADGMKAYEMLKAPLLLVSQSGKIVQFKIEGL